MQYRYKPTGAVIEIASVLTSPDWEPVGTEQPEGPKKQGKKMKEKAVEPNDSLRHDR